MTSPIRRLSFTRWSTLLLLATALGACGDEDSSDTTQGTDPLQPGQRLMTWAVSPQDYNETFPGGAFPAPAPLALENQTLRQIMHVSVGGSAARVRLSNLFGNAPLSVAGAHIARAGAASAIDVASDAPLTFGGQASVSIPAGQEQWSDPSPLPLSAGEDVAVTLFLSETAPVSTVHGVGSQTQFIVPGNALSDASFSEPETITSYYWVTGIDVGAPGGGVIVTFGDSITDGVGSTPDTNHRYPNFLAERVRAEARLSGYGVIDEGISGNRILNDVAGPSALSRFSRDVNDQPGASHVIILIGINDLGFSGFVPAQAVTAEQVTSGLSTLISEAKQAGLQVLLATLTPLQGTMAPYYSEQTEALRGAVNAWIRTEADVDGVIDFDRATQDPSNPLALQAAYDSGDHLHPNDAGYQAMANAIDLGLLR
ncbi:MAG TPA: SGNH/GDSL hydrolase family protein [Polyangiaceae bacterium]|nr:SGNH/GDSL hydrolase family protein [Polyangiaceae bacterium]